MFAHIPLILAQEDSPGISGSSGPGPAPGNAVTSTPGSGAAELPPASQSPFSSGFFIIMMVVLMIMIFLPMRAQKKEQKKRMEMISALKKGDRVQTIGGIIGSVIEVRDSDVVLKVDENANTRIKFARSAIQSVIQDKETA